MSFQKKLVEVVKKNASTKRMGQFEPHWRNATCQACPVGVVRGVGTVAPVVDKNPRDAAVQAAVALSVSTSSVHTDGQVEAGATTRPSYASVATQVTLMLTGLGMGLVAVLCLLRVV